MKTLHTIILSSLLLIIAGNMTSCGKEDCDANCTEIKEAPQEFLDYWYFPEGSWWVYKRVDTMADVYDTAIVESGGCRIEYDPHQSPYDCQICRMAIDHSTKQYGLTSRQYISNSMFSENTVSNSGFVSGTGVFFRWPIQFDYKLDKILDTLAYEYEGRLLQNAVHTQVADEEFWIVKDVGVVKYLWHNGHVWEFVDFKIA